jgi:protein-S-isoprenylcysteine O-methyltransferase Ste14
MRARVGVRVISRHAIWRARTAHTPVDLARSRQAAGHGRADPTTHLSRRLALCRYRGALHQPPLEGLTLVRVTLKIEPQELPAVREREAMTQTYEVAMAVAVGVAAVRAVVVAGGIVRAALLKVHYRWSLPMVLLAPEWAVLGLTAWRLGGDRASSPTTGDVAAAVSGGALGCFGLGCLAWAVWSWPGMFAGHAVPEGHRLIIRRAFGVVRHPAYTGAVLVWLGLAVAFQSLVVLAATVLYVLPAYLLYAREEEAMMLAAFGDEYRRYQQRVPGFVPRPRARAVAGPR